MKDNIQSDSPRLLQRFLEAKNATEAISLMDELQKKEHTEVRKALTELRNMQLQPDIDVIWDKVQQGVKKENKRRRFRGVLRIASCLLPLVILTVALVHKNRPETKQAGNTVEKEINIENKAYLKTAEGNTILLSDGKTDTICDSRGETIVVSEKNGKLLVANREKENESQGAVEYHTIVVPRGGKYDLELADGTTVMLNAESELKFPQKFNGNLRKVFLKGEGYFDVAKDGRHPFIVEVENVCVSVSGTQFNINAYPENKSVVTTLVTGCVKVSLPENGQEAALQPGKQAICMDNSLSIRTVNTIDYTSWTKGRFYFENMPLSQILFQMARWYDIEVDWNDESLQQHTFTGALHRDYNTQELLEMLAKTTNIEFTFDGQSVKVSRRQ